MENDIQLLLKEGRLAEALTRLQAMPQDNDEVLWQTGQTLWRLGRRGEAMSAYARAVEINPQSPARMALEQSREIMDFFNHDMLNP